MNNKYKNIKGICFDYWGVFSPMQFPTHQGLLKHGVDKETRHSNDKYLEAINDWNMGEFDEKEFIKRVGDAFGIELPYNENRIKFDNDRLNYPLIEIVKKLKTKYRIGLLSNGSDTHAKEYIYKPKLDFMFDVMVLSHQVKMRKPQREIYLLMAKRLELKPQEILYLDDQPSRLPPKELGFRTLLYEGEKTDKILETLI